jgi:fibronectin type 3 domain-containing protein
LGWDAPANDGGAAISNYEIYRGTSSGSETLLAEVGNTAWYTDTSVTNGTTYHYKVAVKNVAGIGWQSGETSATPSSAPSAAALGAHP